MSLLLLFILLPTIVYAHQMLLDPFRSVILANNNHLQILNPFPSTSPTTTTQPTNHQQQKNNILPSQKYIQSPMALSQYHMLSQGLAKRDVSQHSSKPVVITNGLVPSYTQIKACNSILSEMFLKSFDACKTNFIPATDSDSHLEWLETYINQACHNEKCYNAGVPYVSLVKQNCPAGYIGRVVVDSAAASEKSQLLSQSPLDSAAATLDPSKPFSSTVVIYADADGWIKSLTKDQVEKFPICTKDITDEFCVLKLSRTLRLARDSHDQSIQKDATCSRCSAFILKSIYDLSKEPPHSGLVLNNPSTKEMDREGMLQHLKDVCGQDLYPSILGSMYANHSSNAATRATSTSSEQQQESWPKSNSSVGFRHGKKKRKVVLSLVSVLFSLLL